MTQVPFCAKCLSGHLHTGEPGGCVKDFAGTPTYFAPSPSSASKQTIVLLTDIFGVGLPNVRLVADEYARAGYNVIVPDILHGDSVAADALDHCQSKEDIFKVLGSWFPNHGPDTVTPVLDAVFAKLRSDGQKIGIVGYCFGGKYVFHYTATDKVDAGCAMHPSMVEPSTDASKVKKPLGVHVAASDEMYDAAKSKEVAKILEANKVPYENRIYDGEGVGHGFAVRADLSKPAAKNAKEEAISASIAWFQKFL